LPPSLPVWRSGDVSSVSDSLEAEAVTKVTGNSLPIIWICAMFHAAFAGIFRMARNQRRQLEQGGPP
jgi:hypothetical protein